jgi:hypothetical protein
MGAYFVKLASVIRFDIPDKNKINFFYLVSHYLAKNIEEILTSLPFNCEFENIR